MSGLSFFGGFLIKWAHLPLCLSYGLQLMGQKSPEMATYPVLTITICTAIAMMLLSRSAESPGSKKRLKQKIHEGSTDGKESRESRRLQPIPSVVQPNKPIVVIRRDATRLYLAPPDWPKNDNYSSTDEKKLQEDVNTSVVDCATTDFLCIATDPEAQQHVLGAIERYGVGSCGPRGFFGTLTPHIMVEREFTAFLNQPAILYPSAAVVIPSALPILCGKGDVLIISEVHSLEIARAAALCGAKVVTLHLPYLNLQQLSDELHISDGSIKECTSSLKNAMCKYLTSDEVQKELRKIRRDVEPVLKAASAEAKNTCWLVADTITKDGILCLPEILSVCEINHVRIFLNEGLGLGVLGSEGRGVPEFWCDMGYATGYHHFDLVASSLEHAFSGLGGICTGALHLVEQQRNMGLGYCFSASAPPGLCECARYTLRQIPNVLPALHESALTLHKMLLSAGIPFIGIPGFPAVFIQLPESITSAAIQDNLLCHRSGDRYLVGIIDDKTIRVSVTIKHKKEDIEKLSEYLESILKDIEN